nr:probable LRR receptor-like serine/threonine-protein kinase At1g06840 isoform X2 [Tanacetum cinerariifolium]
MLDVVRELEHILEKMPEIDTDFSKSESRSFVESSSTSSFYSSSNVQGSDLSRGGNPIELYICIGKCCEQCSFFIQLNGSPNCRNSSIQNKHKFCGPKDSFDVHLNHVPQTITLSMFKDHQSLVFVLRVEFEEYVTSSLNLEYYQLFIDSIMWGKGPRWRIYLKLFLKAGTENSNTFSRNEVLRIRGVFTTWVDMGTHSTIKLISGSFTVDVVIIDTARKGISKGVLVTVVAVPIARASLISSVLIIVIKKQHEKYKQSQMWRVLELPHEVTCSIGLSKKAFFIFTPKPTHQYSTAILKQATFSSPPNSLRNLLILDSQS